jgi:hypothetical protein
MSMSRRDTLKLSALAAPPKWLGHMGRCCLRPRPLRSIGWKGARDGSGVTVGVAWPRGALPRNAGFAVAASAPIPAQSWVTGILA